MEANYAWNRLVYAFYLTGSSFQKNIGTICQPFNSQLGRMALVKSLADFQRVMIGSICNLYYYTFKPNSTPAQVDHYWLTCVRPIMEKLVTRTRDVGQGGKITTVGGPENIPEAIMILTGLFDSSTPRLWQEDHIAEKPLVRPDELPALDPKWLRKNASEVFAVIGPMISKTFLDMPNSEAPVHKLWRTLISAVAAAASKEVKVSSDTANFIAHAFSLLLKIWSAGPPQTSDEDPHAFVKATQHFVSVMIEHLGLLPFTETRLSMGKQNTFLPVATPSHRPGKGQGVTRTPLHHLFSVLSTQSPGVPDDNALAELFRTIFSPFLVARAQHTRTDLAVELMRDLPVDAPSPFGPWLFISEVISSSIENSQATHSSDGSGSAPTLGHEYREMVKHLERGMKSTPNLPWEHWQSLFSTLVARVTDETGEAGCAIVVIEPLAKAFADELTAKKYDSITPNFWKGSVELLATAKQPRDRQALDAARRHLWGTSVAGSRSTAFDPFDNLYRLMNQLLEASYNSMNAQTETVPSILTEVAAFISRCNGSLVFRTLTLLQPGIVFWIQDTNERYSGIQPSPLSEAVSISNIDPLVPFPIY